MPACRYSGFCSSRYAMPPASRPSTSITRSVPEASPRSSAAISPAACGSPHHRATASSAWIARSGSASAGRPGRMVTCGPASSGRSASVFSG